MGFEPRNLLTDPIEHVLAMLRTTLDWHDQYRTDKRWLTHLADRSDDQWFIRSTSFPLISLYTSDISPRWSLTFAFNQSALLPSLSYLTAYHARVAVSVFLLAFTEINERHRMALHQKTWGKAADPVDTPSFLHRIEQFAALLQSDTVDIKQLRILAFNGKTTDCHSWRVHFWVGCPTNNGIRSLTWKVGERVIRKIESSTVIA